MHHAKRVPWVKIVDTGCLADSGRVGLQSWEQYGVKILEISEWFQRKQHFAILVTSFSVLVAPLSNRVCDVN